MGELPGRCGLATLEHGIENLKKLLGHAAEKRIQEKMRILLQRWEEQDPEELLCQLLFKSLGYSPYAQVFEELAKQYQFKELRPFFRQPQRTTRILVLSRWFGACSLFEKKLTIADPTVRYEFQQWKDAWQKFSEAYRPKFRRKGVCWVCTTIYVVWQMKGFSKAGLPPSVNLLLLRMKKNCGIRQQ